MRKSFFRYIVQLGCAAVLILTAAAVTSCSARLTDDNNPTVAWQEFCGYISDGDLRSAVEMTGNTLSVSSADLDDEIEGQLQSLILKSVSVRSLSDAEVSGFSAHQKVEITHLDMRLLTQKALAGIMRETKDYEWKNGSYKTDEEIAEAVKNSLISQLKGDFEDCMVTEEITVEFRYKDDKWIPVMSDELYNALTGYASEVSDFVDGFFEKYQSEQSEPKEKT